MGCVVGAAVVGRRVGPTLGEREAILVGARVGRDASTTSVGADVGEKVGMGSAVCSS